MIALEQHILQPLQSQVEDAAVQASARVLSVVQEILAAAHSHIEALNAQLVALGGHAGSPIKSGVAAALGAVASVIDNVRKTEVSKDLRDDYTALCLATASYNLLHATALGFGNQTLADLAKQHLTEYGALVMKTNALLPFAALKELRELGVPVDPSVAEKAQADEQSAWQEASAKQSGS